MNQQEALEEALDALEEANDHLPFDWTSPKTVEVLRKHGRLKGELAQMLLKYAPAQTQCLDCTPATCGADCSVPDSLGGE